MLKKVKILDEQFWAGAVIVSSLALRNFQYLLYLIQLIFLVISLRKYNVRVNKKYFLTYGCFVVFAGLSVIWAGNQNAVYNSVRPIVQSFVICIFLRNYVSDIERINKFIHFFCIAAAATVINLLINTSVSEWKKIYYFSADKYVDTASSMGRLGRTINLHPNTLGMTVIFCLLFCIYSYMVNKKKVYLLLSVGMAALLLLSKSRSSLLIAVFGVFLLFILLERNGLKRIGIILISIVGVVGILTALVNVPLLYNIVGYRLVGVVNFFSGVGKVDASTSTRMSFITIGWDIFAHHPIWGVGMGNFGTVAYSQYNIFKEVYAHNTYIELLADLGLIGFSLYYIVFLYSAWRIAKSVIRLRNKKSEYYSLAAFLLSISLVDLMINFTHITYDKECMWYINLLIIAGSQILNCVERQNEFKRYEVS